MPIPKQWAFRKMAKQGVLLLNASLTVRASEPRAIRNWDGKNLPIRLLKVSELKEMSFLCCGENLRRKKQALIDKKTYIIKSAHPSLFLQKIFLDQNHFQRSNLLNEARIDPIDWAI